MPPVPVLYLIHSLGQGGSERQLASIACALDPARFTPHAASVLGGYRADEMSRRGIPVWTLPLRSYAGVSTVPALRRLCAYVRSHRIALLHAFDYSLSPLAVAAARLCRDVRVLTSQRCQMELVPARYRALLLPAHALADGIVANCEFLRRHLHDDYRYPASQIEVCWNGIDTGKFRPSPRQRLDVVRDAGLVIGTVCVLRPEKNLSHLLEAFAKVRALAPPRTKLLIVGGGPERAPLEALAARLGIVPECCFLPDTPDVTAALASIDIFVHPSLSEGLPNAVMEALACGCTVLASRVGGCPELIEDGVHGLLCPAGSLAGLVSALQAAIAEPELRCRMAAAAAARIQEHFSIAASARRMEEIYLRRLDRQGEL